MGLLLGERAPIRFVEQVGLEAEVDRTRGDIERKLLWIDVVLDETHRERQKDPAREPPTAARHVAVDGRPREGPVGGVEATDPEHPEKGSLASDGRRRTGSGGPGPGERLRALRKPVERPEIARRQRHAREYGATRPPRAQ